MTALAITTSYRDLKLRDEMYGLRDGALGELPDDGIVDDVAVERTLDGRRPARLTPREVVCIVYRAARAGRSDSTTARMLGADTPDVILGIRVRHGIPTTVTA